MGLFNILYRDTIQSPKPSVAKQALVDELDNLAVRVGAWALVEHNEDGTHKVRGSGYDFVPIGGMIRWSLSTPPSGWLLCNGAAVSRSVYPILFRTIGITSGAGDGTTTFNVPNVANYIILAG